MDQLLENLKKKDLVSIVKRLGREAYIYQLTPSLAVFVSDEIILLSCLCIASTILQGNLTGKQKLSPTLLE